MQILLSYIPVVFLVYFAWKRLRTLLQFYQQEEYDTPRFARFIFSGYGQLIDKKLSFILLLVFLSDYYFISFPFSYTICLFIMIFYAGFEKDPTQHGKKKLVLTSRAKRIYYGALTLSIIAAISISHFIRDPYHGLAFIGFIQALPFLLIAANSTWAPYEKTVQKKFRDEAVKILNKCQPTIIGITGSYGKTSVKHTLAHILSNAAPTLSTPGSINTEMGIVRIIREQLKPEHQFFIVEMGAYGIGSIERLCKLTPPHHGILTAIGNAHYERFKTLDNVAQAKFELHHAVKNKAGKFIINLDQVEHKFIQQQAGNADGNQLISVGENGIYKIENPIFNADGLYFELNHIHDKNKSITVEAPLFGQHQIANVALATAMAIELGVPHETIRAALKTAPQIKHRLEVQRYAGSATIIDDAYNANPTGFLSALSVLDILGKAKNGRRILTTPGMVELGALHNEKHHELGQKSGQFADIILVIKADRIPTFVTGAKETISDPANIHMFATFHEAKDWLDKNAQAQDVILYENDLPDLYERKISL